VTKCVTALYLSGISHHQDPPRETPKAVVTIDLLKEFYLTLVWLGGFWNETARVSSVIAMFV